MTSFLVVVVVVIGIVVFLGVYLFRVFNKPVTLEEMVAQKSARQVKEQASAKTFKPVEKGAPPRKFVPDADFVTLEEIERFSESVPEISVQLLSTDTVGSEVEKVEEGGKVGDEALTVSEQGVEEKPGSTKPAEAKTPPASAENEKPKEDAKEKESPKTEVPTAQEKKQEKRKEPEKPKGEAEIPTYTYTVFAAVIDERKEKSVDSKIRELEERLMELGFKSTVIERKQAEVKVYMIQVNGEFTDYDEAEAIKKKLRESGFSNPYILRRTKK